MRRGGGRRAANGGQGPGPALAAPRARPASASLQGATPTQSATTTHPPPPPPPRKPTLTPPPDLLAARRDAAPAVPRRPDAVHLYGVDLLSTADCMAYFSE